MIVSDNPNRSSLRWLQASVLLCALAVLPLGFACQRGDAVIDPAEPTEAANLMKTGGQRDSERQRDEGERDAGIEDHLNRIGVTDETVARIRNHLKESGVTDEQIEQTLRGMLRVVYEVQSEGEEFELDPRLWNYFRNKIGLTDKQIELVQRLAQRISHGLKDSNRERGANEDGRVARYRAIEARIKAAVEAGEMTEEEAEERLIAARKALWLPKKTDKANEGERDAGIEEHFNRIGVSDETVAGIRNHLKESGVTDEQIEQTLRGMLRVVYEMKSEGEEFELDPRFLSYFQNKIGLTDEQIELVQRLAQRIAHGLRGSDRERGEGERDAGIEAHFNRIGVSTETFDRIRIALTESGLQGKQIEQALDGILRVVHEMKSEGEEFELDPRFLSYFQNEIRLTDEQIELVQGLARRIAHGLRDSDPQRGEG